MQYFQNVMASSSSWSVVHLYLYSTSEPYANHYIHYVAKLIWVERIRLESHCEGFQQPSANTEPVCVLVTYLASSCRILEWKLSPEI